jgi:hypothetical protein
VLGDLLLEQIDVFRVMVFNNISVISLLGWGLLDLREGS